MKFGFESMPQPQQNPMNNPENWKLEERVVDDLFQSFNLSSYPGAQEFKRHLDEEVAVMRKMGDKEDYIKQQVMDQIKIKYPEAYAAYWNVKKAA